MYQKEGYWNVEPKIKALSFPQRGKFQVTLQDGRSITMPISAFPSMKKVPVKERKKLVSNGRWLYLGFVPRSDSYRTDIRQLCELFT